MPDTMTTPLMPDARVLETLPSGLRVRLKRPTMRTLIRSGAVKPGDELFDLVWAGGIATPAQTIAIKDLMALWSVRDLWDEATGTYQPVDLTGSDIEGTFTAEDIEALQAFVDMTPQEQQRLYGDATMTPDGRVHRGPAPWEPGPHPVADWEEAHDGPVATPETPGELHEKALELGRSLAAHHIRESV